MQQYTVQDIRTFYDHDQDLTWLRLICRDDNDDFNIEIDSFDSARNVFNEDLNRIVQWGSAEQREVFVQCYNDLRALNDIKDYSINTNRHAGRLTVFNLEPPSNNVNLHIQQPRNRRELLSLNGLSNPGNSLGQIR